MINEIVVYLNQVVNDLGLNNVHNEVIGKRLGSLNFMDIYELPNLRLALDNPNIRHEMDNVNVRHIHNKDENKFSHVMTNENKPTYYKEQERINAARPYGVVAPKSPTPEYDVMEIVPITGQMAVPIRKNIYQFFSTETGRSVWDSFSSNLNLNIKYVDMIKRLESDYKNTTVRRIGERMTKEEALYIASQEYDKIK